LGCHFSKYWVDVAYRSSKSFSCQINGHHDTVIISASKSLGEGNSLNTPGFYKIWSYKSHGSFIVIKLVRNMIKVSVGFYESYYDLGVFAVRRPADAGLLRLFGCFDVRAGLASRRRASHRRPPQALLELASAKSDAAPRRRIHYPAIFASA
jgi:hypothetical protein